MANSLDWNDCNCGKLEVLNIINISIDLFSLHVLLPHFRSHDGTLENTLGVSARRVHVSRESLLSNSQIFACV